MTTSALEHNRTMAALGELMAGLPAELCPTVMVGWAGILVLMPAYFDLSTCGYSPVNWTQE